MDKERFANPALSIRGGIPILFPICGNLPNNNLPNNIYSYKGNEYTLKQHGFARDLPWNIDLSKEWPTLSLSSNHHTKAIYPFDFQLVFTYKIQQDVL